MIVWGGSGASSYLNTGGRYVPCADGGSWLATRTIGAPKRVGITRRCGLALK